MLWNSRSLRVCVKQQNFILCDYLLARLFIKYKSTFVKKIYIYVRKIDDINVTLTSSVTNKNTVKQNDN